MKNLLFLAVGLLAAASPALAQVKYPPRPAQGEFIYDDARLLKDADSAEIRKICGEVLAQKRAPIVVVTIKSLSEYGAAGWPIQRYAMNLFAEWAVGWSDWNYGILLLVSTGDKKARIEMGASWGHLKDPDALRVMNEEIVPQFKRGEYSAGILAGVKGLRDIAGAEIKATPTPQVYGPAPVKPAPAPAPVYRPPQQVPYQTVHRSYGVPDTSSWLGTVVLVIIGIVVVVVIISLISRAGAGATSWGSSPVGGGYNPGCSAFAGGCLGSGMGSWFGGGGYHSYGYWNDPWDRPWGWGSGWGGGWFGGGSTRVDHYYHTDSGSSSSSDWGSSSGSSSSDSSWGSSDSSSSGGGSSGGGGASGEW